MENVRISIEIYGKAATFDVAVPDEDVVLFHEKLYQMITEIIWKENHYHYKHAPIEGYVLGAGPGCGEEYSDIPGYEGSRGYENLLNEMGGYLSQTFKHPKNGHRFVAVEWLGSEVDEGYKYIDVEEAV
jgi:hypothetical protein